jgi:DNA polymerase III subunit alpha
VGDLTTTAEIFSSSCDGAHMPLADFVHLRVHTAYSLSAGAIPIKELVARCQAERMPAVAVTDTGNLFGALEVATTCAAAGIQPIIGCEIVLERNGASEGSRPERGFSEPDRIVLLVQDETGYRNLLKLVSRSYLAGEASTEPAITRSDLAQACEGLLCLTGGPRGPVGRLLGEGQAGAAEAVLTELAGLFPNRLYVELMRHGTPEEMRNEPDLVELAYRHELPLVATNDAYFPDRDFYEAHDALLCVAETTVVADQERRRLTPYHFFRSAAEMREVFADLPEACDNTLVIARRCSFIPQPRQPILPVFPTADGVDDGTALRCAARVGLDARLARAEISETAGTPYRERL